MNLENIFSQIEKTDPEVYDRLDNRRSIMKNFAKISGKVALATIPVAIGSMFSKAYGRDSDAITDVLNFALKLEYLESEFYNKGNASSGLIVAADQPAFTQIAAHENAHVAFLKTAITALGGTAVSKPTFDFTGGKGSGAGPFTGVFTNYDLFLAVSQTFEDTGVRAYKGQAPALMSNNDILTAALQIHSVEARHASHIRTIRRGRPSAFVVGTPKSWITGNQSNIASTAVQASYNGEELTTQAGVNIVNIGGQSISANAASEAFDEPLTMAQILTIVDPFFV